ncbi:hypothetical protein SCLCIDRAFT_1224622 [Scleroderma citrinum Foug A]|uniref:Uncharacterized protein n=1 Tax=Scleroderma citrinum Foug A TaxID=1036808 RepID=A0A0C2YNM7_9AGAM|nr:hypothetical protein SCLCIDRAFT_1224622 [Scleroderma citrinum Foug A]
MAECLIPSSRCTSQGLHQFAIIQDLHFLGGAIENACQRLCCGARLCACNLNWKDTTRRIA